MVTVEFNRLIVKPEFKILDIGCGSGRHTCAAYQCQNVNVIGVDLKFDNLTEAKERLELHDRLEEHRNKTDIVRDDHHRQPVRGDRRRRVGGRRPGERRGNGPAGGDDRRNHEPADHPRGHLL